MHDRLQLPVIVNYLFMQLVNKDNAMYMSLAFAAVDSKYVYLAFNFASIL